jgi:hypothetical protein
MSRDNEIDRDMLFAAQVVEYGAHRLAEGARKFQLKSELKEMFGCDRIRPDLYETYLTKCRRYIQEAGEVDHTTLIKQLVMTLRSCLNEGESVKDKVLVAGELRALLGLDRVRVSSDQTAKRIRDFVNENG